MTDLIQLDKEDLEAMTTFCLENALSILTEKLENRLTEISENINNNINFSMLNIIGDLNNSIDFINKSLKEEIEELKVKKDSCCEHRGWEITYLIPCRENYSIIAPNHLFHDAINVALDRLDTDKGWRIASILPYYPE